MLRIIIAVFVINTGCNITTTNKNTDDQGATSDSLATKYDVSKKPFDNKGIPAEAPPERLDDEDYVPPMGIIGGAPLAHPDEDDEEGTAKHKTRCGIELSDGNPCNDGNICTSEDVCLNGLCVGTSIPNCCTQQTVQQACDDNNVCTDQVCNISQQCENPPITGPASCDDGNACTIQDTCSNGTCIGQPLLCFPDACNTSTCNTQSGLCEKTPREDGTDCTPSFPSSCVTSYQCMSGQCVITNKVNGTDCSTSCNLREFCYEGTCMPRQPAPQPYCVDADTSACTSIFCFDLGAGPQCSETVVGCIESNPCETLIGCNPENGQCEFTAKDCNDNDPCTEDSCVTDNNTGCVHTPTAGCQTCSLPEDCFPPDQPLPSCSTDWQADCVTNRCIYLAGNNNCPQPSDKCQAADCTLEGCKTRAKTICADSKPYDCEDVTCDPTDGQCKPVTNTEICPYPQNVCCETGTGGYCVRNCIGFFCGCLFDPQVPLP